MISTDQNKTNDSAKGSIAGFLFQFEKALLLLAELNNSDDFITVEQFDDVSTHQADGSILATFQAKHSVLASGSTFEDTSKSLWRTIEIWVKKLKKNTFNDQTQFVCSTNKTVPEDALIRKIINDDIDQVIISIEELIKSQEEKLEKAKEKDPDSGKTMASVINLMKYAAKNKKHFEKVKNRLVLSDKEDIKTAFLNRMHAFGEGVSDTQRDRFFDEFYGWIFGVCLAKWRHGEEARICKKDFDTKWQFMISVPSIINAIFRTKESLGSISEEEMQKRRTELFVKQIEDIEWRKEAKERAIKNAILDFIYYDIELKHVVLKGDFTQKDFDEFLVECKEAWQKVFDRHITKELDQYSKEEMDELALKIFNIVMQEIVINFKEGFHFTTTNMYVRNGSFLELSNRPDIGWHPEWELKYINDGKAI